MKKILNPLRELLGFPFLFIELIYFRNKYEETKKKQFLDLALKISAKNKLIKSTGEYQIIFTNYEIVLISDLKDILKCVDVNIESMGRKDKTSLKKTIRSVVGLVFNSCLQRQEDVAFSMLKKIDIEIKNTMALLKDSAAHPKNFKINWKLLNLTLVYFKENFEEIIDKIDRNKFNSSMNNLSSKEEVDESFKKMKQNIENFLTEYKIGYNRKTDFPT